MYTKLWPIMATRQVLHYADNTHSTLQVVVVV